MKCALITKLNLVAAWLGAGDRGCAVAQRAARSAKVAVIWTVTGGAVGKAAKAVMETVLPHVAAHPNFDSVESMSLNKLLLLARRPIAKEDLSRVEIQLASALRAWRPGWKRHCASRPLCRPRQRRKRLRLFQGVP